MKLQFKIINTVIAILVGAVIIWAAATGMARHASERKNRTVEICIDIDEADDLCRRNNYSTADFLQRCRAIGVVSVAISEEPLSSLENTGKIVRFGADDYQRLKILDVILQGSIVAPNSLMVASRELSGRILQQLRNRYGIVVSNITAGKYQVIYPKTGESYTSPLFNDSLAVGFPAEKIAAAQAAKMLVTLKVQNAGDPRWITSGLPSSLSTIFWDGREIPGYPGNENIVTDYIREHRIPYVEMEFVSFSGDASLRRAVAGNAVRGHTIATAELNRNPDPGIWISRWLRAANERGIRFFYFRFYANKSIEDNLSYLRTLARKLKKEEYTLGHALPPEYPIRGNVELWRLLAVITAILMPLIGLYTGNKQKSPIVSYAITNVVTLSGALLMAALFYDAMFMQKLVNIPYVRLIFFLPIVLSVFIIYPPPDLRRFWSSKISVKYLAAGILAAVIAAIIIIRSGNNAADWLRPETGLRQFVENLFYVRPRTKEFLFGQPLLLAGFALKNPALIILGMIGQVSIINTFLHAHAPLAISLVRSLHGIWLGAIIGYVIIIAYRRIKRNKP